MKRVLVLVVLPIIIYISLGFLGMSLSDSAGVQHILIVNTWNDFPEENATDVDAMPAQALYGYLVLKNMGYLDEDIDFMLYHSNDDFIDSDGDGTNDLPAALIDIENDSVNKEKLRATIGRIGNIARQYDEVIIYVVAHGQKMDDSSAFSYENGDLVSSNEFGNWLNDINCKRITIFLDFCFSGNFAQLLEKSGRLIICSAEDNKEAWCYWDWANTLNETDKAIFGNSGSAFFHPFWKKFGEGANIEEAFEYGKEECFRWGFIDSKSKNVTQNQNPQMYFTKRTVSENFVFFYPGGSYGCLIATILLVLVEAAILAAAVRAWAVVLRLFRLKAL